MTSGLIFADVPVTQRESVMDKRGWEGYLTNVIGYRLSKK